MQKLFDFHFHLLFKHYIADPTLKLGLHQNFKTKGLAKVLNDLVGGAFDSQSSPIQVKDSPLQLGVISLSSVEYAFAERILHLCSKDFSFILPINDALFNTIKKHRTSYWKDFLEVVDQYKNHSAELAAQPFDIQFLRRSDFEDMGIGEIETALTMGNARRFALSIEGGHNLSTAPSGNTSLQLSEAPHMQVKKIQEMKEMDFMSINLCHLSDIPEQRLGGFAQGANKLSQIAFKSDHFMPTVGLGLTELGKKVIRQCLLHADRPLLIDVKHMSLYTRLEFYRYKEKLAEEAPSVARLPIISSHTGFTFTSIDHYLGNACFRSTTSELNGIKEAWVESENRKIGRTDDKLNKGLYGNPWTINLFDEEIVEIMESGGMMGISLDQRILGASNPALDSVRDKYYEREQVSYPEWKKLFKEGKLPGEEGLFQKLNLTPTKEERHIMLLCLHLVHAVRLGYARLAWQEGTSPWDHLCIGSDFDGLINPINGFEDVTRLDQLAPQLRKFLPLADKYLLFYQETKALQYNKNGTVNERFLQEAVDKFCYKNGLRFLARYLTNWSTERLEEARQADMALA